MHLNLRQETGVESMIKNRLTTHQKQGRLTHPLQPRLHSDRVRGASRGYRDGASEHDLGAKTL